MIGQMMEAIEWHEIPRAGSLPAKTWATTGTKGEREPNVINSLYIDPNRLRRPSTSAWPPNTRAMEENETRWEEVTTRRTARSCSLPTALTARIARAAIRLSARKRASRPASSGPSPCGPSPARL